MTQPRDPTPPGTAVEIVPAVAEAPPSSPRDLLLVEHREARRRRDAAPLNGDAYREASVEIARLEIAISALER